MFVFIETEENKMLEKPNSFEAQFYKINSKAHHVSSKLIPMENSCLFPFMTDMYERVNSIHMQSLLETFKFFVESMDSSEVENNSPYKVSLHFICVLS